MSVSSSTSIARITSGRAPTIYNITTVATIENSQLLTNGTKKILIRARGSSQTQIAFLSGTTNTIYITLEPHTVFEEDGLDLSAVTLFVRTDANDIVEVLEWS